jgi:non-ribosomal peptide synthetase component F
MSASGVHRIIEGHAACRGEQVAIASPDCSLSYRELNQRANAVARFYIARGLRRGSSVVVRMNRGPHAAIVLLAILKAGASYMWIDGDVGQWPDGVSRLDGAPLPIDEAPLVTAPPKPAPNLPILTRPEDVACVLPQRNGLPGVLVPHATIASLQSHPVPEQAAWQGEAGAMDLWLPLMAGATVAVHAAAAAAA